ncbi:MAG: FG-GAP-like repeat-containing protein [Chryseotalea sp.]
MLTISVKNTLLIIVFSITLISTLSSQPISMERKSSVSGGLAKDIELHPSGSLYVVIESISGSELYRSVNKGISWAKVDFFPFAGNLEVDVDNGGTIWVASSNTGNTTSSIFKSEDNGVTWVKVNTATNPFLNSATWAPTLINRTGTDANSPIYVYTTYSSQLSKSALFRSVNGGATWTEVYQRFSTVDTKAVASHPNGTVILLDSNLGVVRSASGLAGTFSQVTNGLPTISGFLDFSQNSIVWFGNMAYLAWPGQGIYRSSDFGVTWEIESSFSQVVSWQNLTGVTFASAGTSLYALVRDDFSGIYLRESSGTWSRRNSFNSPGVYMLTSMVAVNFSEFYGIGSYGVFSSLGDVWTPSSEGINRYTYSGWNGNNPANQPLVLTSNGLLAAFSPIFLINPETWRWSVLSAPLITSNYIARTNNGRLLVSGSVNLGGTTTSGFFTSTNNGETWTTLPLPAGGPPAGIANIGSTLYVGASRFFFSASENSPENLTEISVTGIPSTFSFWSRSSFFIIDKILYAGGINNGEVCFYKIPITEVNPVATKITGYTAGTTITENALFGKNNNLMIYSKNGNQTLLSVSRDLGNTWVNYTIPNTVLNFYYTSSGYPAYSTSTGRIFISYDQGEQWVEANLGISSSAFTSAKVIETTSDGYLHVLVDQYGLYRSTQPIVKPQPPTELVSHSVLPLTVRIGWNDNSDNEDYFVIERSEDNNQNYDSLNWFGANEFSRVVQTYSVESNKTYYYRVKAVNKAGESKYSNEVMITTPIYCAPTIPTNRTWSLTTLNESGLGIRTQSDVWLSRNVNSFYSFSSLAGNSPSWNAIDPSLNTITATLVENCGKISLSVSNNTYYGEAMGTWDPVANKITLKWAVNVSSTKTRQYFKETTELTLNATAPPPTTSPSTRAAVFDATGIYVQLLGSTVQRASEIILYRSTSVNGPWTNEIGRISSTQSYFIDRTNLQQGITYHYKTKAINAAGEAPLSSSTTSIVFSKSYLTGIDVAPPDNNIDPTRAQPSFIDINNDGVDELFQTISTTLQARSGFTFFNQNGSYTFRNFGTPNIANYRAKFADMNNDGNIDMVSRTIEIAKGKAFLEVYLGDGTGNFSKTYSKQFPTITTQISVIDFNQDGFLDFLANIAFLPEASLNRTYKLVIFINDKNGNYTELFPFQEEVASVPTDLDFGDYDDDGDLDLLQAGSFDNGVASYRLHRNNGNGTYTKISVPLLDQVISTQSVGSQWLDWNNDGKLDIAMMFATSGPSSRVLFINNGDGSFSAGPVLSVSTGGSTPTGILSLDIENDGDADLLVHSQASNGTTQLYINEGGGATLVGGELPSIATQPKSGMVTSDINNDGYTDVFMSSADPFFQFYTNGKFSNGNWLKVKLQGTKSNRSAIGSRIQVITGAATMQRQISVTGNGTIVGQNSLVQHFGLGTATSVTVRVIWPNGRAQVIRNVAVNRTIGVVEETDPPSILQLFPAKAAVNVTSATTIRLTLDGTQTVVADKKIRLFAEGTATPLVTLQAGDAVANNNVYTFTLPAKLPQGKLIRVEIEEGAFIDNFENPTPAFTGNDWTFTVGTGPLVTNRLPSHTAVNVADNTNIEITFDRTITTVAGKKIRVMDAEVTLFEADVATLPVVGGNKLVFDPPQNLPYLKTIRILLDEGAIKDDVDNIFSGLHTNEYQFTTIIEPDIIKPTLVFQPAALAILEKGFAPVAISVTVTDNRQVDKVFFTYRKSNDENFVSIELTKSSLNTTTWTGNVLNSFVDDMGMEYYLSATDPSGNIGRLPLDNSTYYQTQISLTGINQPVIRIPGGGTAESWRIISIPYELSTNQVSEIFSSLGTAGAATWRMLQYEANTNVTPIQERWKEYPSAFQSITRGQGYFVNAFQQKDIQLTNSVTPANSQSNLFEMNLVKGWNMIGNPYALTISWDDIRTYNNITDKVGQLKVYTNGTYTNANELLPLRGAFVFANEAINNVKFSFQGQTNSVNRISSVTFSDGDWLLPITLKQGQRVNDIGGVGMHKQSNTLFDELDDFNPPGIGSPLHLSFQHPEHFMQVFARDVVSTASTKTWEFTAHAQEGVTAELTWNTSLLTIPGKQLFLLDVNKQELVNMTQENNYTFLAEKNNSFRIYYGTDIEKDILPEKIFLSALTPNPTQGSTRIQFTLPDKLGPAHVSLEVIDMMGRKISILKQGVYAPGFYTEQYDATHLTHGLYTVRCRIQYGNNEFVNSRLLVKN